MARAKVPNRGKGKQSHKCGICNSRGHRAETCKHGSADLVRRLRVKVKELQKKRGVRPNTGTRGSAAQRPRKSGAYKKAARAKYTGSPKPPAFRPRTARAQVLSRRALVGQPLPAWERLSTTGFGHRCKHFRCSCGGQSFDAPQLCPHRSDKMVFIRCKACRAYHNVYCGTAFHGLRAAPDELHDVVVHYTDLPYKSSPNVDQLVKLTGFGRTQVGHIVSTLLSAEAKAGKDNNSCLKVSEGCEGDAHVLRRTYIGAKNDSFQNEVRAVRDRLKTIVKCKLKPKPTYSSLHVRVAGLAVRGGPLVVQKLGDKLVQTGAVPPPEAKAELISSKLLEHFDKPAAGRKFIPLWLDVLPLQ
ncbi:unnamed protein product [Polarella glacialis]|uniref:Uncharacterized protein n=1 Tax=Polarella glacialis TaxID=89957 RepID=A0A813HHH6_POLGL|nr:unnamed protein product [Polarella glacialis]